MYSSLIRLTYSGVLAGSWLAVTACGDDESGADTATTSQATTSAGQSTGSETGPTNPPGTTGSGEGDSSTGGDSLQALQTDLEALRAESGVVGMSVGLVLGDEVAWTGGFGTLERGSDRAVRSDTPFQMGSVSKTFIATALVRAVELGLVDLDAPLDVPFTVDNPFADGETITLRQLSMHTSTIRDAEAYGCAYLLEAGDAYLDPEIDSACPTPPLRELGSYLEAYLDPGGALYSEAHYAADRASQPGAVHEYSNVASALAGYALGHATQSAEGIGFEAFCQREVFDPLGMTSTAWHRQDLAAPEAAARGHMVFDGEPIVVPRFVLSTYPDGGLWSSADDLSRYLAAIVAGGGEYDGVRILEESSVEAMLDFQAIGGPFDGQGVFWYDLDGFVGHTGGDPGVSTAIGYLPQQQWGIVLLFNDSSDAADDLQEAVFARVLDYVSTAP